MEAVIYGFIFGVISGCGVGGGSILVPLLVLFMRVPQPIAQGVTLVAFLPSAITALIIHIKNKNVDFNIGKKYILPGVVFAGIGSFVIMYIEIGMLRKGFGIFLIIFAIYQCVMVNKSVGTAKKDKCKYIEKSYK